MKLFKKVPFRQLTIILVLWLLFFGMSSTVYSGSDDAHLFISPDESTMNVCGPPVTITVEVEDVVDLTAYHLEILFDPTVIEVLDVVNGEFLAEPEDADYFYEPTNEIDNVNGVISFGMAQQGVETNPAVEPQTGSGSLIVITLRAHTAFDTTTITINPENSYLVEWPSVFAIPFTTADAEIEIWGCYYFPLFYR